MPEPEGRYETRAETVALGDLRPHPRNYKRHPQDQIDHIVRSIRSHGLYRPIIVSRTGTILAGHGVREALLQMGASEVSVYRTDLQDDEPDALRLLTGDNEIARLGLVDDRALTELLKEVKDTGQSLQGTGFDESMLANLVFVSRPRTEIEHRGQAGDWAGLPQYHSKGDRDAYQLLVSFEKPEERERFVREVGLRVDKRGETATWSTRWPFTERNDVASVRFTDQTGAEPAQEATSEETAEGAPTP